MAPPISPIENVMPDRCDRLLRLRPCRPHVRRVIEQCARHDWVGLVVICRVRDSHGPLPCGPITRGNVPELGPREVCHVTVASRIPTRLVHHSANRMREVRGAGPVQGHFGNGILARGWFAASLEIDVLRQALQIARTPQRAPRFPLYGLNRSRHDVRFLSAEQSRQCRAIARTGTPIIATTGKVVLFASTRQYQASLRRHSDGQRRAS